jgi:hypothetical protein
MKILLSKLPPAETRDRSSPEGNGVSSIGLTGQMLLLPTVTQQRLPNKTTNKTESALKNLGYARTVHSASKDVRTFATTCYDR